MAYFQLPSVIMLPEGCAPTTSTTKCHYYEKPSTVPVASAASVQKRKKREREKEREKKEGEGKEKQRMRTTDWAAQRLRLASRTFINLDRISRDSGELFRKPSPTTPSHQVPQYHRLHLLLHLFLSSSSRVSQLFFLLLLSNSFLQDPALGSVHPKVKSEKTPRIDNALRRRENAARF